MTEYDRKKAAEAAIESASGVLTSVRRQRQHVEHEMERMSQAHDDLMKIEGWVRGELAQLVDHRRRIEQEEGGQS